MESHLLLPQRVLPLTLRSLRYAPGVYVKKLKKIKEMIKLRRHYLYTEKPGSQFPLAECAKNTRPLKSDILSKGTCFFYLNVHSSTDATIQPAIKSHHLISPQMERWSGLKCINLTCTENVI